MFSIASGIQSSKQGHHHVLPKAKYMKPDIKSPLQSLNKNYTTSNAFKQHIHQPKIPNNVTSNANSTCKVEFFVFKTHKKKW